MNVARQKENFISAIARFVQHYYPSALCVILALFIFSQLNVPLSNPDIRTHADITASEAADIDAVLTEVGEQRFLSLRPARIVEHLRTIPWIGGVSVQRGFLTKWSVSVDKSRVMALWQDDYCLDERGQVYHCESEGSDLPRLRSYLQNPVYMLEHYQRFQALFAQDSNLHIASLALDVHGAWQIVTGDGVSIHFMSETAEQLLLRFAQVYGQLQHTEDRMMKSVNLNYTNGFAVEWCRERKDRCVDA